MDENVTTVSQDGFPALTDNGQLTLFNLQEMAVKKTHSITLIAEKIKTAKKMYDDTLNNSDTYRNESEKLKQQQETVKAVKKQLQGSQELLAQAQQIKDFKSELKEKKEAASQYALRVLVESGNNEFEKDGEVFQIHTVAKLVKRRQ